MVSVRIQEPGQIAAFIHAAAFLPAASVGLNRDDRGVEIRAAALDLQSIARNLAEIAACWDAETSKRELLASAAADRFAVKLARLAREIEAVMDEIAPPRSAAKRIE